MKRFFAISLVLSMLLAICPLGAFAETTKPYINAKLDAHMVGGDAPRVDGVVNDEEYGKAPSLTYSENKEQFDCPDDHDDYNDWDFDFYITWDDYSLYMAWVVKSDVHQPLKKGTYDAYGNLISDYWPEDGSMLGYMWMFSNVSFIITPYVPESGITTFGNDMNYLEVGMCELDDGSCAINLWNRFNYYYDYGLSVNDWSYLIARDEEAKTTTYEIEIPWAFSGLSNQSLGDSFGLTFSVAAQQNYNDKRGMIEWNDACIGAYPKTVDNAGVITLSESEEITAPTSGTCGSALDWTFDKEYGLLTISGEGDMDEYNVDRGIRAPWYAWRYHITDVLVKDGVTSIGTSAFENCEAVEAFYLPDTLEKIGSSAFFNCINLWYVEIPKNVTKIPFFAFAGCERLADVVINEGVTEIGMLAFGACDNLSSITLPKSINKIDEEAFFDCSCLYQVTYAGSESDWNNIEIASGNNDLLFAYYSNPCEHIWEEIYEEPTCTEEGYWRYLCTSCHAKYEEYIPELGHNKVEADCENPEHCTQCGKVYADALGHTPGAEPTCTEAQTCTVCGDVVSDPLGHKTEWKVNSDGTKEKVCDNCGTVLETLGVDEFIPNDINGDNKFNVFDYVMVKNCVMNGTDNEALFARADVNGDGKLNIFDYVAVKAAYFAQ